MNLETILKERKMSATALAKAIGTDKYIMSKFNTGKVLFIPQMMYELAKFLDVNVLDIVSEQEITFYDNKERRTLNGRNIQSNINYQGNNYQSNLPCCNELQQKEKSKVELLFGEPIKKVQFRLNKVSYNLLELGKKTLGCTDKHDLYRKIFEPYLLKRIKREQQKRKNQKQNIINLTRKVEFERRLNG